MGDGRRTLLRGRRPHAVRVALATAAVVLAAYTLGTVVLDGVVTDRLTGQADTRLAQTLDALGGARPPAAPGRPRTGTSPGTPGTTDADHDVDDAPRFAWFVAGDGRTDALTTGAPVLPHRAWSAGPTTVFVGDSPFRVVARAERGGTLVAGESLAGVARVYDVLVDGELAVGIALVMATFAGALVVGLLASAPVEVVRRRQAQFTADASHELRTPLSVIEAEVEVTLARPRDRPAYEDALHRIADETLRLRSIVDDLLWLARMDDGRQVIDPRAVADVATVATRSVARFSPLAASRQIRLRLLPAPREARVRADPAWIDRLVGVLLDNACKFCGEEGRVDVGVVVDGATVVLVVDDSGPGIPPDQRGLIFDRFRRGTDGRPGFGLGLAIADAIVRATGGQWAVERSPLGGARFAVRWRQILRHPATPPDDRSHPGTPLPDPAPDPAPGLPDTGPARSPG